MDFVLQLKQQKHTLTTQLDAIETLISTYEGAGSITSHQPVRRKAAPVEGDKRSTWTPERRERFAEAMTKRHQERRRLLEASKHSNSEQLDLAQSDQPEQPEKPEEPPNTTAVGVSVPEPVVEERHEEAAAKPAPAAKKRR